MKAPIAGPCSSVNGPRLPAGERRHDEGERAEGLRPLGGLGDQLGALLAHRRDDA